MSKGNTKFTPAAVVKQDTRPVRVTDFHNVRQMFLQLTHRTCPEGYEDMLYGDLLTTLGFERDEHGNYTARRGTDAEQRIVFAAHMDTVGRQIKKVTHRFSTDGRTVTSDGKTILGADDKAGMTILLYMLAQNIPGTYMLFTGEEVGCIGSRARSAQTTEGMYDAMISFDRAGYRDVITHQASGRTASDEFALALAAQLNSAQPGFDYAPSPHGVYTDSNEFRGVIPECTNVSVGYSAQHGVMESQDLLWLEALAFACCKVNWAELPIVRKPEVERWGYDRWSGYADYTPPSRQTSKAWDHPALWDDEELERGSMVGFYEAKYGLKLEDFTADDVVELIGAGELTEDEFEQWAWSNYEKVFAFMYHAAWSAPSMAEQIAVNLNTTKKGGN